MSSLLSSIKNHVPHQTVSAPPKDALASLPTPPTLPPPTRLVIALATIAASTAPLPFLPQPSASAWRAAGHEWAIAVHRMLQLDEAGLPASVSREQVRSAAEAHWADMQQEEREDLWRKVVDLLVMASIFQPPIKGEQVQTVQVDKEATVDHGPTSEKVKAPETVPTLSYTPIARRFIYTTLHLLLIPVSPYLAKTEHELASRLYTTLQRLHSTEVESARASQSEGTSLLLLKLHCLITRGKPQAGAVLLVAGSPRVPEPSSAASRSALRAASLRLQLLRLSPGS